MSASSIIAGFTNLFKTQHFSYFDQKNQLQAVPLNFIHCIFRRLGCHKETHLKNVVSRAYALAFNGELAVHNTEENQLQLLKLIAKVQDRQKATDGPFYADFAEVTHSNGQKVKLKARLVFEKKGLNPEMPRDCKFEIKMISPSESIIIQIDKF